MHCAHCGTQVADGAARCPACGKRPTGDLPKVVGSASGAAIAVAVAVGLLLALVAVGGIVAAVFIPNFLDALQKAKQKRTVADLRQVATAIESYGAEHGIYPEAEDMAGLEALLVPDFIDVLPHLDGWKHEIVYGCWQEIEDPPGCDHYRLVSPGRDGLFEVENLDEYEEGAFPPVEYDGDIVVGEGGAFIRRPDLAGAGGGA